MILPHTMTVTRLGTSGANRETYTARPDVACFLQPLGDAEAGGEVGILSTQSKCYIPFSANVKLKDRVTIDGVVYQVVGERTHQYGTWPHRVLRLEALS